MPDPRADFTPDEIAAILQAAHRNNVKTLRVPGLLEVEFHGAANAVSRLGDLDDLPADVGAEPPKVSGGGAGEADAVDLQLQDDLRAAQTMIDDPVQFEADQIDAIYAKEERDAQRESQ